MSKRTYPHYVGKVLGKRWPFNVTCKICPAPATCYAEVQWSWFRGDDETYRVCDEHLKLARENVTEFCSRLPAEIYDRNKA